MTAESKAAILADSWKFQDACRKFVGHNAIIYCVSSLIYSLREVAEQLDDYDEYLTLTGGRPDYEGAACYAGWDEIDGQIVKRPKFVPPEVLATRTKKWAAPGEYDLADLVEWLKTEPGYHVFEIEGEDGAYQGYKDNLPFGQVCFDEDDAWKELLSLDFEGFKAKYEEDNQEDADSWEDACNVDRLEPDYREVYEHWICDSYFAARLKERGEIVEEYLGLTIWGRTTTGQAIYMDYVIESMVKDLDDDHWIFNDK